MIVNYFQLLQQLQLLLYLMLIFVVELFYMILFGELKPGLLLLLLLISIVSKKKKTIIENYRVSGSVITGDIPLKSISSF